MFTPERHLPQTGQRGHSPQRHTAAGTAAPTTTYMGNTVPHRRANPTQTAHAHPERGTQAQGQRLDTWMLVRPQNQNIADGKVGLFESLNASSNSDRTSSIADNVSFSLYLFIDLPAHLSLRAPDPPLYSCLRVKVYPKFRALHPTAIGPFRLLTTCVHGYVCVHTLPALMSPSAYAPPLRSLPIYTYTYTYIYIMYIYYVYI